VADSQQVQCDSLESAHTDPGETGIAVFPQDCSVSAASVKLTSEIYHPIVGAVVE